MKEEAIQLLSKFHPPVWVWPAPSGWWRSPQGSAGQWSPASRLRHSGPGRTPVGLPSPAPEVGVCSVCIFLFFFLHVQGRKVMNEVEWPFPGSLSSHISDITCSTKNTASNKSYSEGSGLPNLRATLPDTQDNSTSLTDYLTFSTYKKTISYSSVYPRPPSYSLFTYKLPCSWFACTY